MEKLINLMQKIENTSPTNEKRDLFIDFLNENTKEENYTYLQFLSNTILPEPQKLNIGEATLISAISHITGFSENEIKELNDSLGNLSSAVEYCFENKKQMSWFDVDPQNINTVLRLFQELPAKSKVSDKIANIKLAFSDQTPKTARYLSHFVLGGSNLSVGYKNKMLIKALARHLNTDLDKVKKAYTYTNSIPNIVNVDIDTDWKIILHHPYKPQLADKPNGSTQPNGQHIDYKLDGGRIQLHGDISKVTLFTRGIEDVTNAFPDVYKPFQDWLKETGHEVILDSELMMGGDFKSFGKRIKRKKDIEQYAEELPATPHVFDILYLDGVELIDLTLTERREILNSLNLPEPFKVVDYEIFTSQQQLNNLYGKAIKEGYEGVMIKEDVSYELNNRSKSWKKIKPTYPADLTIDDAVKGTGRNVGKYSSFTLATYEGLTVGKVGIGIPDDIMDKLTEMFGKEDIILEIEYESMQKSDKYTSGYAMRFARVVGIRVDKTLEELTTLKQLLNGVNIT